MRGHGIVRAWGEGWPDLDHMLDREPIPARPTWLVVHPDAACEPAVRLVADRITEAFRAFPRCA